jgi:hypothetical protein
VGQLRRLTDLQGVNSRPTGAQPSDPHLDDGASRFLRLRLADSPAPSIESLIPLHLQDDSGVSRNLHSAGRVFYNVAFEFKQQVQILLV